MNNTYKILKIDGPNIVTDKGMVSITGSQYADRLAAHPVDAETWRLMRNGVVLLPQIVELLEMLAVQATWPAVSIRADDILTALRSQQPKSPV